MKASDKMWAVLDKEGKVHFGMLESRYSAKISANIYSYLTGKKMYYKKIKCPKETD